MQLLKQAAHLNAVGVYHLQLCKASKALDLFGQALAVLKQAATSYVQPQNFSAMTDDMAQASSAENRFVTETGNTFSQHINQMPHRGYHNTEDEHNNDNENTILSERFENVELLRMADDRFHIYNDAIIFDPVKRAQMRTDIQLYSTIVLYNMALGYHLEGQNNGDRQCVNSTWAEAIQLYTACSGFFQDYHFHCSDTMLLWAGILNNVAHILYTEFCDYGKSNENLELMWGFVVFQLQNQARVSRKKVKHIENFGLNLHMLRSCHCAPPA